MLMAVMASGPVPELVSVTAGAAALLSPMFTLPNARFGADSATTGEVPVPVSGTVCGLPGASSVTLTVAARAPVAVGAKLTPRKQWLPAAKLLAPVGQAGVAPPAAATKLKSPGFAPVLVMLVMFKVAVPELMIWMLVVAVVAPKFWLPRGTLVGLDVTAGPLVVVDAVRWKTVAPPTPLKSEIIKK